MSNFSMFELFGGLFLLLVIIMAVWGLTDAVRGEPSVYHFQGDTCSSGATNYCGMELWDCASGKKYSCVTNVMRTTQ
jgi:hypothetical protein